MLIAIDGPAASGKGTVAKQIAAHYGLEYLDTGRLYRLVGWELLKQNKTVIPAKAGIQSQNKQNSEGLDSSFRWNDNSVLATKIAKSLDLSKIGSEEIEAEEVGMAASIVSAIPEVRAALLEFQRTIAKSPKGAVLDGRDIGTIICPNADFKFFITAEPKARAKRRYLQLKGKGKKVKEQEILNDIIARDKRDSNRDVAPLVPAIDAIYIDTTNLGVEEVFEKVKGVIEAGN
jgi:CMP/dCMP kinase